MRAAKTEIIYRGFIAGIHVLPALLFQVRWRIL